MIIFEMIRLHCLHFFIETIFGAIEILFVILKFPTDLTRKHLWIHTLNLNVPISKLHRVYNKNFEKNRYIFSNSRKFCILKLFH